MARMLVTCPETAHLEEIEFDHTPLGMLIAGCTRLGPGCPVTCERVCARMFDRRNRITKRRA